MASFDARVYGVSDFLEWRGNQLLDLSPQFQRRGVWTRQAKSFLIDTIIRGKPMPKVIITQELIDGKNVRTVVDGQQRLRAIFEYIAGSFSILKSHNDQYGGLKYDDLPKEVRDEIQKYEVGVDILFGASFADILDIFARINTYSVTLNPQEKLNAKYLGIFKTYSYELGHAAASYFKEGNILSVKAIGRMGEAQLASDVLVALCEGPQTNKNIEKFYKQYENSEDVPTELFEARDLFNKSMAFIGTIYPAEEIKPTNWARQHLFYTLFVVVAHALGGIKGLGDTPRPQLTEAEIPLWRFTLDDISSLYDVFTAEDALIAPKDLQQFIDYSRRRTTDTEARVERAKFVLHRLAAAG